MAENIKAALIVSAALILSILLFPAVKFKAQTSPSVKTFAKPAESITKEQKEETFRLYRTKLKKTEKISAEEYIFCVVASEMPISYGEEALKAQAVAAYTFAERKKLAAQKSAAEYDITDDYTVDQAFKDKSEILEGWKDNSQKNEEFLSKIISSVKGEYLTYKNEIAFTPYFAISPGLTDKCSDVFSSDLPYLIPCDSSFDKLAQGYRTSATFTKDELKEKLKITEDITEKSFSDFEKTSSGLVKSLKLNGKKLSGSEISKALNLRSRTFEISYNDSKFTFTVSGYGHNVGMSQTGAKYLAAQGSGYKEILSHYYPGCEIKN